MPPGECRAAEFGAHHPEVFFYPLPARRVDAPITGRTGCSLGSMTAPVLDSLDLPTLSA
jgi:hypothetical protein